MRVALHRQFDLWVGTWDVTGPAGKFAGVNRIERKDGGCDGLFGKLASGWIGQGTVLKRVKNADGSWSEFGRSTLKRRERVR